MRRLVVVAVAILSLSAIAPAFGRGSESKGGWDYWKDHASNPRTAHCNPNDQSGCVEKN
jgi:hypothetical protein